MAQIGSLGEFKRMRALELAFAGKNKHAIFKALNNKLSIPMELQVLCILGAMGGEDVVPHLARILLNHESPLVRHEAAFYLGQLGYKQGAQYLTQAVLEDPDPVVRHEAAVALSSIGSEEARPVLEAALKDPDEMVRLSAESALFNLNYLKYLREAPNAIQGPGGNG